MKRMQKIALGIAVFSVSMFVLSSFFDGKCKTGCIKEAFAENASHKKMKIKEWDLNIDFDEDAKTKDPTATEEEEESHLNISFNDEDNVSDRDNPKRIQELKKLVLTAKDLADLEIKSYVTDWTVDETAEANAYIEVKGYLSEEEWKIKNSDKKLKIETVKKGPNSIHLYLPKTFKGKFSINSVAGDLVINKLASAERLIINSVSGELTLSAIPQERLKINTISGDSKIEINNPSAQLAVAINSVSGDLDISLDKAFSKLGVDTVTGDINLKGKKDLGLDYDLHGVSSDFHGLTQSEDSDSGLGNKWSKGKQGSAPFLDLKFNSVSGDLNWQTK